MTAFDLLFILVFLAGVGALLVALVSALRGRRAAAFRTFRRTAVSAAAYLAAVALVSLVSPRRFRNVGEEQCSDDWCIAVADARVEPDVSRSRVSVDFRLRSRAERISQRERGVVVYLRDAVGRRYDPEPPGGETPFDVRLAPGETRITTRSFLIPRDAPSPGVVVAREFSFPRCCILFEENSLLHKRTVVPIGGTPRHDLEGSVQKSLIRSSLPLKPASLERVCDDGHAERQIAPIVEPLTRGKKRVSGPAPVSPAPRT